MTWDNNPEQSFTTEISKHEACRFSIIKKSQLTDIKGKKTYYRGEDCMAKDYKKLKEWVMKIVNYEMKEMLPLTTGQKEYHEKQKKCFTCDKRFCYDKQNKNYKNFKKVCDIVIIQANIEVLLIVYVICNIKPLRKFL